MPCIFCNSEVNGFSSTEHIVPESLGNTKNFLPKGIVCDVCNSYFAIKIENPVLSTSFFSELRARNEIPTKKGNFHIEPVWFHHKLIPGEEIDAQLHRHKKFVPIISIPQPFASLIFTSKGEDFLITSKATDIPPDDDRLVARLLGKIAIEALAQLLLQQGQSMELLVSDERLSPIKNFVRFDKSNGAWPYIFRKIYEERKKFYYNTDSETPVDVLYQYGHFFIEDEMFIIVILKGYEFALNMGYPSIEKYKNWVNQNKGQSLLYQGNVIE